MSELKLKVAHKKAAENLEDWKQKFRAKRRELDHVETGLVEAREAFRRTAEELETFLLVNVGETSIADDKEKEIAAYKERMPELLKSIENEKPIPFKTITDLETLPEWPKRKGS
jgi:hypothetical protein